MIELYSRQNLNFACGESERARRSRGSRTLGDIYQGRYFLTRCNLFGKAFQCSHFFAWIDFSFSASEWFSGKDKAPTATPSRSLPSLDTTDMYYTLDFSESQSSPLIQ
ncbi:hypothetical protein Zmor_003193 [Zophobas morio]|uniref:Uncharacterized protein n=1 Tax=Zophobas morio TaxID=2755281 RepID=A0AA38M128_9CUCU|nr:hypothetical protein Zmor_003193 [Zophobas morio]